MKDQRSGVQAHVGENSSAPYELLYLRATNPGQSSVVLSASMLSFILRCRRRVAPVTCAIHELRLTNCKDPKLP